MAKKIKYWKLIDAVDTVQKININGVRLGKVTYGHKTMYPGEKMTPEQYGFENDDAALLVSLQSATVKKPYSAQTKAQLESLGVDVKEEMCQTCGGKAKKLVYCLVEVVFKDE